MVDSVMAGKTNFRPDPFWRGVSHGHEKLLEAETGASPRAVRAAALAPRLQSGTSMRSTPGCASTGLRGLPVFRTPRHIHPVSYKYSFN